MRKYVDRFAELLLRLRNRHFFLIDLIIFGCTPALALLLRVEAVEAARSHSLSLLVVTLVFGSVKVGIFVVTGLYNRYWRYASIDELAKISLAINVALLVQLGVFFVVLRPFGFVGGEFPRSVPIIEALLALMFVGGVRYSVRFAQRLRQHVRLDGSKDRRVLVVGAGEAGVLIVEEMRSSPELGLMPLGFVDDDDEKQRMRIRGLNVLGRSEEIAEIVGQLDIDLIIIAIPRASGAEIRKIAALCKETGVETKTIPSVYELLNGHVSVRQLRDMQVEDLLRRPAVQTDTTRANALLQGSTVLVTGAGGSIGSELCRQIVAMKPNQLVLVGHGENSIFKVESELRKEIQAITGAQAVRLQAVIADIRDRDRMEHVFALYRPTVVFHAAAHKHVPLMESNLEEAVSNNILGTHNLLRLAARYGVSRFVSISTDKAVNPTSIMGATKRVAELLVQQVAAQTGRAFSVVRFGNVLGSRGSVLQIFRDQLERGGPLTVTHPDISRYFMTIPEAAHLVLQAAAMSKQGEVFLLDMGEPTKIVDLARDVIRLSSRKGGKEVEIVFTGLRPGEKLFEELSGRDELFEPTEHEKILVCAREDRLIGAEDRLHLTPALERMKNAVRQGDQDQLFALLQELVPAYKSKREEVAVLTDL
ncbi:MAG TPA: nucleoside-diphosphate sugar epimerase/dehydratase [Rhodothermales bacterium]|nr:nucleoside-diphosphate sugar epimerase/dehydratase [Rhodothermales bacterium]